MKHRKWYIVVALMGAMALVGAACGDDDGGDGGATTPGDGGGAQETCDADEFGCATYGEGEPIRLGTLLAISGDVASLGLDSQHGVEIAVDQKGQVLGHDVELQHEDDLCSADGGQAGSVRLAADPTILAVVGTSCSSAAFGVADQNLGEAGIVLISPSNTGPGLTDPATHNEWYLRTAHNDKIQGAVDAEWAAVEQGATTAATIHDGSPYAEGLANVFASVFQEQFGGTITAQEAIQVGDTEFGPLLETIAANPPDVLFFPIFNPEGPLIVNQALDTPGLENTILMGADGLQDTTFIEQAGENGEGMITSASAAASFAPEYETEFLPAYMEAFGDTTSTFHAHAFDATNMIFAAIEEVGIEEEGTLYIPRTAFRDALFATTDFPGLTGSLSCNENGDCQLRASIAVSELQSGEWVPLFSKELTLEEAEAGG